MLSDDYENEQEELKEKLTKLNDDITQQEEQTENIGRFIDRAKKYPDVKELTPAILNDMAKAVYVHAPGKSGSRREQKVDISYNFVSVLPVSLLSGLLNDETA